MKYTAGLSQDLDQPVEQLRAVYLHPGQILVTTEPAIVTTILGSCVSVCLWEPELAIGGINHYLLPAGMASGLSANRYGNVAIETLLNKLGHCGVQVRNLRAKIFGGACVLAAMRGNGNAHLGIKNIEIATRSLDSLGIPLITSDVGGNCGRKLIFHPHDGTAFVKHL